MFALIEKVKGFVADEWNLVAAYFSQTVGADKNLAGEILVVFVFLTVAIKIGFVLLVTIFVGNVVVGK